MASHPGNEPSAPRPPSTGLAARAVALELFQAVQAERRPLEEAIAGSRPYQLLSGRDRAFVRLLVASTLRRLGQIDALIRPCLDRPLPRRAATVRAILRLGVAQLVVLRTPAHAVVDTAVALCARTRNPGQKGLVNAVLRRLSREGPALYSTQDAARLNTPDWLWRSWEVAYSETTCRRIAAAHLAEAPLDITVQSDAPGWAERLAATVLPTGSLRREPVSDIAALPGYDAGGWWVQDAAAALPARLLLAALGGTVRERSVADLCAAPGGKTAQLAAAGARVTAVDRSARRLATLRQNMGRLGLAAEIVAADAATWRPDTAPDAILLDAPCTATGTIRRHPDILRNKTPAEVARMAALQGELLAAASGLLAPGGVLVYSVCSLQPEEGPAVVEALLARRDEFVRLPIAAAETGAPDETITPDGDMRTLPCHLADAGGMDGFYIARLQRQP